MVHLWRRHTKSGQSDEHEEDVCGLDLQLKIYLFEHLPVVEDRISPLDNARAKAETYYRFSQALYLHVILVCTSKA